MSDPHRVVIIGGGFGGLHAAQGLRREPVHATLLDRRNFHLFQPLLYQVATGGLSPGDIASPLRWVLRRQKNVQVLLGEMTDLDADRRRVLLADGEIEYDTLIVATGAVPHYFGNDAWKDYAVGLKTIEDATHMRSRIFRAFEAAEREPDPEIRSAWLTFVVVGGGPTGVELAGALGEITRDTLRGDFRSIQTEESRILLVDQGTRVLSPYPPSLSAAAERSLISLGVRPLLGVRVTAIDAESVTVKGPGVVERIPTRTVLWAAGVGASPMCGVLERRANAKLRKDGRVLVERDFTIAGHAEIFVIGDMAYYEQDGAALPGTAPVAMQEGDWVARTIARRLRGKAVEPFRYRNKGEMATIGRASAVAKLGPLELHGFVAWVFWLFVHLLYLVGFENRVVVMMQWGFQYFTYNRGARLITGDNAGPGVNMSSR